MLHDILEAEEEETEDQDEAQDENEKDAQDENEKDAQDENELVASGLFVRTDFGMAQHLGFDNPDEVALLVQRSHTYLEQLKQQPDFKGKEDGCRNNLRECSIWAFTGECESNPSYMSKHCAAACQTCEAIHINPACLRDNYKPVMWEQPGALNQMFQRITTDPQFQKYNPTVLSSPHPNNNNNDGNDNKDKDGPWIVTLDDFITEQECQALIDHGAEIGYETSKGIGDMQEDGTYGDTELTGRTSTNAWCTEDSNDLPLIKAVMDRITQLVEIPYSHAEFIQLLKYEPGQFYEEHHDWSDNHLEEP
jgi:prolyl 4-hydroxylase